MCSVPIPADHRHLLHVEERRDRLHLRDLPRALRRRGRVPADGQPHRLARRARALGRALGVVPDPDRPRVLLPLEHGRADGDGGSSRSTRARPARPSASSTSAPWEQLVAANPVLEGLEPDAEALIVNRLGAARQHAIVPIDECYRLVGLVRVSWEGISGGTAHGDAVARVLRGDGGARACASVERRTAAPALELEVSAPSRRCTSPSPALHFRLRAQRVEPGATCTWSRSRRRCTSIPALRATTPRRASSSSTSSARPSAGRRRRRASSGRASSRSLPSFTSRGRVHARRALHLRPRGRRGEVPRRAARRRGAAELPLLRPHLLPRRGRAAADRADALDARRATACRSPSGGAMIDHHSLAAASIRRAGRTRCARSALHKAKRGHPDLRRGDRRSARTRRA